MYQTLQVLAGPFPNSERKFSLCLQLSETYYANKSNTIWVFTTKRFANQTLPAPSLSEVAKKIAQTDATFSDT